MQQAKGADTVADGGTGLLLGAQALPEIGALERALRAGPSVAAGGLWGSAQALVLAALVARSQQPWVAVAASEGEAQALCEDLAFFGAPALLFPARESGPRGKLDGADLALVRQRIEVAQRLSAPAEGRPKLLVSSLLALLQPLPKPGELAASTLQLSVGQKLAIEHLLKQLVEAGYERQPLVERQGEVSLRGDIFDVFPFASERPLRIELFDDRIESLRTFDPAEQRSVEQLERVAVCLARDVGGVEDSSGVSPALLLPHQALFAELGEPPPRGRRRPPPAEVIRLEFLSLDMLELKSMLIEIVAEKIGDNFQALEPAKREGALFILPQTSDILCDYPERSVWSFELKTPSSQGYVLVGSAMYRDIAPVVYHNMSSHKLFVGYDDLMRVVDTKYNQEVLTLRGGGYFNKLVVTDKDVVATFDCGLFVLDSKGQVVFQYQNPEAERFIHAEKTVNSNRVTVELEDGTFIAIDMDTKTQKKLN